MNPVVEANAKRLVSFTPEQAYQRQPWMFSRLSQRQRGLAPSRFKHTRSFCCQSSMSSPTNIWLSLQSLDAWYLHKLMPESKHLPSNDYTNTSPKRGPEALSQSPGEPLNYFILFIWVGTHKCTLLYRHALLFFWGFAFPASLAFASAFVCLTLPSVRRFLQTLQERNQMSEGENSSSWYMRLVLEIRI